MVVQNQQRILSPQQRAELFALHTRKHEIALPALVNLAAGQSVSFTLPKVRLLQKINLLVSGNLVIATAAATALTPFSPYQLLRRVTVSINNGFTPINITGSDAFLMNVTQNNSEVFRSGLGSRTLAPGLTVATHPFRFNAEIPIALNSRDAIGLVLLQNEETLVTVNIDIDALTALVVPGSAVLSVTGLTIQPVIETFSIPAVPEAFPDLSVLKINQSQSYLAPTTGMFTIPLPVGMTYRKIIVDHTGITITGNIELVLNQADVPISIPLQYIRDANENQYDEAMFANTFCLDFTYQGLANYGGLRDYIDTERLTEFWLRFPVTSGGAVSARVLTETLSRLTPAR